MVPGGGLAAATANEREKLNHLNTAAACAGAGNPPGVGASGAGALWSVWFGGCGHGGTGPCAARRTACAAVGGATRTGQPPLPALTVIRLHGPGQ